jgi:catechol-2,3-dioxygenase
MQLDEVMLDAKDPAEMQAFYARVLQLSAEPAGERVMVRAGWTRLTFQTAPVEEHPCYHIAFGVPLQRFDAARQQVAAHTR